MPQPRPSTFVAGQRGMVGAAIVRALQRSGQSDIVTRTHAELDLTNQDAVEAFFAPKRLSTSARASISAAGSWRSCAGT